MNIKKRKQKKDDGHRVGRRIRARSVRLIDQNGENLGIVNTWDALKLAEEANLDLVEFSKGETPTCKILDYGKLKYQEAKKEKKKEKKTQEVQFRPKIAIGDLNTKIKNARKFLEKGSTVNLIVKFRGREIIHPETGTVILEKAMEELKDISTVMKKPFLQGKMMSLILLPKAE